MAKPRSSANNVVTAILGVLLFICVVATAVDFYFVYQNSAADSEFLSLTSTAALESQVIPNEASRALHGNKGAFQSLVNAQAGMDNAIDLMGNGDPGTLMPGATGQVAANVTLLQQHWSKASAAVDTITKSKDSILVANQAASAVIKQMPMYISGWTQLANLLARHDLPRRTVLMASQQASDAQRLEGEMESLMSGEGNINNDASMFVHGVNQAGNVLSGFTSGNPKLNINPLPNYGDIQAELSKLQQDFNSLSTNLETLAPLAAKLVDWQTARMTLAQTGPRMLSDSQTITSTYRDQIANRLFQPIYGYALGIAALLLMIVLAFRYSFTGEARRAAKLQQEQNERNQQAILKLLDELGTLADGDLTVKLSVTEDITGAIADSINYTVEALRELVKTINDTAVQVDAAARQTEATASHLAEASDNQSQQITSATESIAQMARSIEQVSQNAERATEVARKSVDIAHKGGDAVRRTIDGMSNIREAIQETSKRMKRLGESSQEIGDIVELINDIAEQTNILALNAAIQASTAGEAGRGFGVVADEVQRLAERAAGATRQIETLVHTIQSDTNEAILSMEQSTSGVVDGAQLAENAGHALDEIENVSNHIARLIQIISGAAREQAQVAGEVSNTMAVIQEITSQTAEGTQVTARSVGNLAALSAELRKSVSGFTLPGSEQAEVQITEIEPDAESDDVPLAAAGSMS